MRRRAMSKREVRRVVCSVILRGPVHPLQFREAWEQIALMAGALVAAMLLVAIALRWVWRVARLLALPVSLPVLTWHYRRVRAKTIIKQRAARQEARSRIHQWGPGNDQ